MFVVGDEFIGHRLAMDGFLHNWFARLFISAVLHQDTHPSRISSFLRISGIMSMRTLVFLFMHLLI